MKAEYPAFYLSYEEKNRMTLISVPQNALVLKTSLGFSLPEREQIEMLCNKILAFGLLNPLTVMFEKGRFIIVDGKKRFYALRALLRSNKLPHGLTKIPCVLLSHHPATQRKAEKPLLMSEQTLVHEILRADRKGATYSEISSLLECSEAIISQARSLPCLHEKLLLAFMNNTIDLAQAAALATFPNKQAQLDLLEQLGAFATQPQIIEAITDGATTLELPNGETLVLPSRRRGHKARPKASRADAPPYSIAA